MRHSSLDRGLERFSTGLGKLVWLVVFDCDGLSVECRACLLLFPGASLSLLGFLFLLGRWIDCLLDAFEDFGCPLVVDVNKKGFVGIVFAVELDEDGEGRPSSVASRFRLETVICSLRCFLSVDLI